MPVLNTNNSPSKSNKLPYSSFCSKDLLAASSFGLISDRDGAEENASFGPSPSKPIINGRRRMNPTEPSEFQGESLSMIGNEHSKPAIVTSPTQMDEDQDLESSNLEKETESMFNYSSKIVRVKANN